MSFTARGDGRQKRPPEAIGRFVIGVRGWIEEVDAAACTFLGYTREELVGMHGSELVPPAVRPATAVTLDGMRRDEVTRGLGQLLRKDGTVVAIEAMGEALPDGRLILTVRMREEKPPA